MEVDDDNDDDGLSLPPPLQKFTEEEMMFKDAVSKFAQSEILPKVPEMEKTGIMDAGVIQGLFDQGFMSVEVPSEYGGSEASFTAAMITVEEVSKIDPSVGVLCDLQNTLLNRVLIDYGSDLQKEKYLTRLATDTVGSFCLTEESSGSDAFALKTKAELSSDKEHYVINGGKLWISNSQEAGLFIVFANVDPSKGYKGITCFIVDRETEGLEVHKPEDKLGIKASSTCPITFNNVKVKKEDMIGEEGQGYKIAIEILNEGRIGIAAQMIGLAQGAFDITMPYLFQRKQFGQFIGDFQAVEHQYAELALEIEAAKLLTYNASRMKDANMPFVKEAAMAKLYASRAAENVASKCVELHGGIGFTKTLLAEKYFRDSKIGSIYEGTSNMQLTTIAKLIKASYKN